MKFLEWNLEQYGVRDITRNVWTYDRWYTTDWPGHHKWTLTSDGKSIKVASYSAYSGSTTEAGITAPLVYYDPANPPALSFLREDVFKPPHPFPRTSRPSSQPTSDISSKTHLPIMSL
jgi:hypothetical protein